jgi:hypothetical protein
MAMDELDQTTTINLTTDPEIQPKGFAATELVNCETCTRPNPPTRSACLYCGAPLVNTAKAAEEVPPEAVGSEMPSLPGQGAYVVLIPDASNPIEQSAVNLLASWSQVKATELQNALRADGPLPLRLATTEAEAKTVSDQVGSLGLRAVIVPESEMAAAQSFRKIRALEISDEALTGLSITSGDTFTTEWTKIVLVIAGRLITTESEATEKKKGGGESAPQREVAIDEPVIDIWVRSGAVWRIFVNSFDFSCLGKSKTLTAFENAKALLEIFRERASQAQVNESYGRARVILANVWPLEKQTKSAQLRHAGIGRREFATVTTTNNLTQFNNYSQMMYRLTLRQSD